MKFTQCRIVGNELPPRDAHGTKTKCLEWIIENGNLPGVHNLWIVNSIFDYKYRAKILDLLKGQEVLEMRFNLALYQTMRSWEEKVTCCVNINAARNLGVKHAQKTCDFVVCLDQDCYFWPNEWESVRDKIEADQKASDRKYYGVNSKRVHIDSMPKTLAEVKSGEAMPFFRHDADMYFNPTIPFGFQDKVELLKRMGYDTYSSKVTGDECRNVGCVAHMAFGEEQIEHDIHYRGRMRQESLNQFMRTIEEKHT